MIVFVPDATRVLDILEAPVPPGTICSVPSNASEALIEATMRRTHALSCLTVLTLDQDADAALAASVGLYFCRVLEDPSHDHRGAA